HGNVFTTVNSSIHYPAIVTTLSTAIGLPDTHHSHYGPVPTGMFVHVTSFGYRYWLPPAADLVFDVRFMENPFYIPELRSLTGSDPAVRDYVLKNPATKAFLGHVVPLPRFALPRY